MDTLTFCTAHRAKAPRRHARLVLCGFAVLALGAAAARAVEPDPARWEEAIQAFERADRDAPPAPGGLLFVGSSSIRLWDLARAFPEYAPINRGFGGSHLSDCTALVPRIVHPYRPRRIVLYAGDNDIAAGKSPETVAADFDAFIAAVRQVLPAVPICFIAIKPSISRWDKIELMRGANALIKARCARGPALDFVDITEPMLGPDGRPRADLLRDDGLHLNDRGYELWNAILRPRLAETRPNIVLVLIDDMGWNDLSCQGSRYFETPAIDRLAAEGIRFTGAYAACAVCSPTRAAVMTGRYPARLGVTDWIRPRFQRGDTGTPERNPIEYEGGPEKRLLCPPNAFWMERDEVTLAEALRAAGYVTCHIGKWHLGDEAWFPEHQGFDVNRGGCDYGQPPSYFDPYVNDRLPQGIPTLAGRDPGEYLTDREADEAAAFIREHRDRPFFLYLAHYAVHTPLQAKPELIDKYAAKPPTAQKNPTYAAMVQSVDEAMAKVLATLAETGLARRTIVLFSSDNGGLLGPTHNGPLRSGKGFPYEGGIRVPLIIRWPGVVGPGALSDEPAASIDFFPTLLEAAGVPLPAGREIDGISLVPHLRAQGRRPIERSTLFWHFPHYRYDQERPYSIVRAGDFKLIKRYEGPTFELYNVREDMAEEHDLAAAMPERVAELDAALARHLAAVGARLPRPNPDFRPPADQAPGQPVAGRKPNVIVILTDDQGTVDAGCFGAPDLVTPAIDALASRGVRLCQFYAGAPVCSPSRAALLTGRYPPRAGVPSNVSSQRGDAGMPSAQVTLAEIFQAAGYATAHVGKWHLGYTPETMPNAQGFDHSFGHMGGCIDNYSHFFYWAGPNRHDLWRDGAEVQAGGAFFPDLMLDEAVAFMEQNRDRPFLLYFAMNTPHYPYQGDPEWLERFRGLPYPRNLYAAFVATLDARIGRLLDAVERLGLREQTIVVFQSDNGHSAEERAHFGGGSAGPYRGAKFSLFEGGIRVPAIISWPGHLPAGAARDQAAHSVDWLPTLAELCAIPLPAAGIDGRSLAPVLASDAAPAPHDALHWMTGEQWAVRSGPWKLIANPRDTGRPGTPAALEDQLFLANLDEDPAESRNFAATHPQEVARLNALHEGWLRGLAGQ